jgi:hypothetical protein
MDVSALLLVGLGVLDGRETSQAFVVDVHTQRVDRGDCHVDAQVEFVVVQQEGVCDVLGGYHALLRGDLHAQLY